MTIQESGFRYTNKFGHFYVQAIEEVIGPEALRAVFNLSGVPKDQYPPPNNFAKSFDFAYFAAIGAALEKLYGARGERSVAFQVGKQSFFKGLAEYGSVMGVSELAVKMIPLEAKLKVGLRAMVETYTKFTDQLCHIEEDEDHFRYVIQRCPICWGRKAAKPICYAATAQLREGLHWVSGGKNFRVEETTCCAMGADACLFCIDKAPLR